MKNICFLVKAGGDTAELAVSALWGHTAYIMQTELCEDSEDQGPRWDFKSGGNN